MSAFTNIQTDEEGGDELDTSLTTLPTDDIAARVRVVWDQNRRAKFVIEQEMLESLRQKNGEYEPKKLAQLKESEMSTVWIMLTNAKCRAATAFILDILQNADEKPWSIRPTPLPKLDPDIETVISEQTNIETFNAAQAFQQLSGQFVPPAEMAAAADKRKKEVKESFIRQIKKVAKEAAKKMEIEIDDQLKEGNWYNAFRKVIDDLVTFPTAVLKGPVIRRKKHLGWGTNPDGKVEPIITETPIPEFDRVSPLDLYPEAGAESAQDGDLIEKLSLSRKALNNLKGVKGYSSTNIDEILFTYGDVGFREATQADTERLEAENKDSNAIVDSSRIDCLEFWGTMSGKALNEWNVNEDLQGEKLQEEMDYEAHVIVCNNITIKAGLNDDPLGKRPYYTTSYEEVNGSIWGHGIPYLIRDMQETVNSTARAMINNLAIASGPQVEFDIDKVPPEFRQNLRLTPWAMWPSTGNDLNKNPAVRFYQPNVVVNELMALFNRASQLADEHLGIPAFEHGGATTGGAADTASGLSMLMTAAARGIKNVIQHLDVGVITPVITAMYNFNMEFNENEDIKGDAQIVARGMSSLVAKELLQRRRTEFLNFTNNDVDLALMGAEGRKVILKELARSLELDLNEELFQDTELPAQTGQGGPGTQLPQNIPPALPSGEIAGGENLLETKAGGALS